MFEIKSSWDEYLQFIPAKKQTIYFSEAYIKSYETVDITAEAFVYTDNNRNSFIFPYLRQDIKDFNKLWDFETPYGYGGPISSTNDTTFLEKVWKQFIAYAKESKCIAGFIRFDPIAKNIELMEDSSFATFFDRHTVAIDLTLSPEDIFSKEIHSKHRNVIRKAEKSGLEFVIDRNFEYFNDFISIYTATMDRLDADEFYYFDRAYYKKIIDGLKKNSFLSVVLLNGEVISIAMIMFDDLYGHYHLAGSKKEFLKYSPNNFLLYKTALYLKKLGKVQFHIGGGTSSDESNSLFKFKKRFSKSLQDFYIGKKVFIEDDYNKVCKKWEIKNPEKAKKMKNIILRYRF